MNRKHIQIFLLILSCSLFAGACKSSVNRPDFPNIVIILTDDQGWGDIASHGNPDIETPELDKLAESGVRFNRFFVSPVCAPTRASLLTGRDHLRTGTQWVTYGLENMRAEEYTFGEVFRDAGYRTSLFGKWHNGSHYPMDPIGQGFEHFFGFTKGHWNNYFDTDLQLGKKMVPTDGYIADVLTDSTLGFIEENKDNPFLAFVSYNTPHSPFQVPDKYFDKYKELGLSDKNAAVYGMVANIDENVGRIQNKLSELDLTDETIVIFMTDNGPNGGDRFNGNMKGWKAKVDEGGVRVPMFISWPGTIEKGRILEELTAHIDFLPSLADLAGIDFSPKNPLDGRSFAKLILDEETAWEDRLLYTHQSRWDSLEQFPASVRNNRYRLVQYGSKWELYDLKLDPSQRRDIAENEPELVDSLSSSYQKWFTNVTQKLPQKRSIPIGYDQAPVTQLPAVESTFSGNLRFFGESGWSNDWLTNWSSKTDKISWDLEVVDEATYLFQVQYTLPEANTGTIITVDAQNNGIRREITDAHNPSRKHSPDRVKRGEVYEKDWAIADLGMLTLPRGTYPVNLSADKIVGGRSIDLKSLIITKMNPN
jgi:arylsulfatase A